MLFSFALIIIIGFLLSGIFSRLKIPGLLAMILTGVVLGPYALNLLSPEILDISADLRKIALIVILARVGLSLNLGDLKKVGRAAILLCFVPALFEFAAVTFFAPMFFDITYLEAAIMGTVVAAISPAVVVPRMIYLMDQGYGKAKSIPQLIMAGASVDDIFVIILFTSFLGMYQGGGFQLTGLLSIPISIITGLIVGIVFGYILVKVFHLVKVTDTVKVLIVLAVAFVLVSVEPVIESYVAMSGLLAVIALTGTILKLNGELALGLKDKFGKVWTGAEVFLFVLVGAAVDITYLAGAGVAAVALILLALLIRIAGVYVSLIKTPLNQKERLFSAIAYLPKATVQAAIGGIPLASGVAAGNTILTVAVIAIVVTAPIGAIGIDTTYKKLLTHDSK